MHNLLHSVKAFVPVLVVFVACRGASAEDDFEGWNLEPGVKQAHLVMVARVVHVSGVTVVEGAKTNVVLREYRFQPVRLLKGLFQRDQLSMTGADLGLPAESAASPPPLEEGEFRLLILAQQGRSPFGSGPGSYGCVSAAPGATTFAQRVPLVAGPDDPLVGVVETLIKVADSRSRRERAKLLIDRLTDTEGVSAVPLLTSLRLRADWAASDPRAYTVLAQLARTPQTALRSGAADVLRGMLASGRVPNDSESLEGVAAALRAILDSDEPITHVRVAALEALGRLLALNVDVAWARELLTAQSTGAATYAERTAAATALSRITHPEAIAAVKDVLAGLPLDAAPARESAYLGAVMRLDEADAEQVLLARLKRSIAGRESLAAEIESLARMQSTESVPLLLEAASRGHVSRADRHQIARALGRLDDDRGVPVLVGWMRGSDSQLKELALSALEKLDSETAAREVRPLLKTEPRLEFKLRIARLLARHGFNDGYALATEHLADEGHTAAAALVLVALEDPRTANDLSAVIAARSARRWYAAALTGLVAIGDPAGKKQLLEILNDGRHPLAAEAAAAVGLSADSALLLPLAELVKSRNTQIAQAALLAVRRFFSNVRLAPEGLGAVDQESEPGIPAVNVPAETRAAIAEAVASLVVDPYVGRKLRYQAFAVVRLLGNEHYAELLAELADQAELEGEQLLKSVQAERRRLQGRVDQL